MKVLDNTLREENVYIANILVKPVKYLLPTVQVVDMGLHGDFHTLNVLVKRASIIYLQLKFVKDVKNLV